MTHLETLKTDLELLVKSREKLKDGTSGFFIKREGYSVDAVIHSYDKIILSIELEIASIEAKPRKKTKVKTLPNL
jgi:hypothetical protein